MKFTVENSSIEKPPVIMMLSELELYRPFKANSSCSSPAPRDKALSLYWIALINPCTGDKIVVNFNFLQETFALTIKKGTYWDNASLKFSDVKYCDFEIKIFD